MNTEIEVIINCKKKNQFIRNVIQIKMWFDFNSCDSSLNFHLPKLALTQYQRTLGVTSGSTSGEMQIFNNFYCIIGFAIIGLRLRKNAISQTTQFDFEPILLP